jgi:hypothetical protein
MALGTRNTPVRNSALFSGPVVQKGVTVSNVLTTGGGVETITTAELLTGLLVVDTQDAQTWTLPTAALLNAAIPGVEVGNYLEFTVINYGDALLTIGLGTGITKTTIATVAAIATVATLTSKRFRLECTGVLANGSTSDAWVLWTISATAVIALA